MIAENWRRIGAIQPQEDGTIAAVWMAHDRDIDVVHVYDACLFKREVLAVVMEGLNARGRWIPIAWPKSAKEIADNLLYRGCNILPEPAEDTQAVAEAMNLEVWERMRSHRMKVDKRLGEWREEFKTFQRHDSKVPIETHPLMAATRHALQNLDFAKSQASRRTITTNHPKIAVV